MSLPRLFRLSYKELFDFIKLMDSKNSPSIFAMSSCLFSKTDRSSSISDREAFFFNPFSSMHSRNRLFGSSN